MNDKKLWFASPFNSQELLKCTSDLVVEVTDNVLDHERARTFSSAADRPKFSKMPDFIQRTSHVRQCHTSDVACGADAVQSHNYAVAKASVQCSMPLKKSVTRMFVHKIV